MHEPALGAQERGMDFEHSPRAQDYIARVERFVAGRVVPNERTYLEQLAGTDDWRASPIRAASHAGLPSTLVVVAEPIL